MAPEAICNCFNSSVEETLNFMVLLILLIRGKEGSFFKSANVACGKRVWGLKN